MNFFQLGVTGIGLVKDAFKQSAFTKSFLKPIVEKHCSRLNYILTKSEKKKVLFYYPMYTILANAEMFLAIKGRGLTKDERKRLTLVGAMATLCDDLIDEHGWTRDQIFQLLANQFEEEGLETKAKLLVALNNELNSLWPLPQKYLQQLKIALEWQSSSSHQLDSTITLEEIIDISRGKNGNTYLMFAAVLDEKWTEKEIGFIYQAAIVGQLTNDAFDMYVDSHNNQHTYINRVNSIKDARNFFVSESRKLNKSVLECEDKLKYKKACIRRMSCMHAYALVAFDHLQNTEKKYGLPIDWNKPTRQEMVTDMALIKNQLMLLKYIMWLSKL